MTGLVSAFLIVAQGLVPYLQDTGGGGACNIPDETGTFVAVWLMEEATSATRDNEAAASCGSNCDLSNSGSVEQDGTNYKEGTYSAHFTESDSDTLNCNHSTTCTGLDISPSQSFLAWVRLDNTAENLGFIDTLAASSGFEFIFGGSSSNSFECKVGDGADNVTATGSVNQSATTWYHAACVMDGSGNSIQIYTDGGTDGSAVTQQGVGNIGESIFELAQDDGNLLDGNLDEVAVIDQALSAAEVCHICSCGVDGSLCTATGTSPSCSYDDTGRNATDCSSCTLPADPEDPIQ